jgi:hypothetical protein
MNKTTKRPPSNTESLIRLKDQGFSAKIEHYRVAVHPQEDFERLVPDYLWRKPIKMKGILGDTYTVFVEPRQMGGATKLSLTRGEEQIVVQAFCNEKDRFAQNRCGRVSEKA